MWGEASRKVTVAMFVAACVLITGGGAMIGLAVRAIAEPGPTLSVSPDSGLSNGQSVTVSGTGFDKNSTGAVIECSNVSGQPTVPVLGNNVPVSCTNPLAAPSKLVSTAADGSLPATTFDVVEGVVGPPGDGSDSNGVAAATDAEKYPCPPTPAQQAAGFSCVITYGDLGGARASQPIAFASSSGNTPGSTSPTATTAPSTTAPSTTVPPSGGETSTASSSGGCAGVSRTAAVGMITMTVDPATCLRTQDVTVMGSGFTPNSPGALLECNSTPGQPTITIAGRGVPVGCSDPTQNLVTTQSAGGLGAQFPVRVGTMNPSASALDTRGVTASIDSASYPCPPTPSEIEDGAICYISYGDIAGDEISVPISFAPGVQPSPSPGSSSVTVPGGGQAVVPGVTLAGASSSPSSTATTTTDASTTTAPGGGALAFTGNGTALLWMGALGALLVYVGALILVATRRPAALRRGLDGAAMHQPPRG